MKLQLTFTSNISTYKLIHFHLNTHILIKSLEITSNDSNTDTISKNLTILCFSTDFKFTLFNKIRFNKFTKMTNKMQLCRIIYCSLAALHVSRDIFAHHQEHLNCIYNFWYYTRMSLLAGVMTPAGNNIRV